MGLGSWLADRTGIHPGTIAEKVGHPLGHYLVEGGKLASLVPGVGPVVGGAMTTAGGLIEGDGVKDSLINGGKSLIQNYALGKAGSVLRGAGGIGEKATAALSAAKTATGGGSSIPGVQGVTDFLGGNGGQNALATAQGINAAMLGKKSSDYANNAMGSVQQNWDERQPLRSAGMAGMLAPAQGIQSRIAAIPNRNPYAAHPAPVAGPQAVPHAGPPAPGLAPAVPPMFARMLRNANLPDGSRNG